MIAMLTGRGKRLVASLGVAFLLVVGLPAQGAEFGLFTYEVADGKVEITDYPIDATGPAVSRHIWTVAPFVNANGLSLLYYGSST